MVRWMNLALPISLAIFAIVWMTVVVPGLVVSPTWKSWNPVQQWAIYNIGLLLIITVFFGGLVSYLLHRRMNIFTMFINGLAGFIFFNLVLDMYEPPMAINQAGMFIIPTGDTLSGASQDYMAAWVWKQVGISDHLLWEFTYIVTPILAIIVAILLFGVNRFAKFFREAII